MSKARNRRIPWALGLFVLLCAWAPTGAEARRAKDTARPDRQVLEVVGFSTDGKLVACKVHDANRGDAFHVRDTRKARLVKAYPFVRGEEKRAWRKAKRAHHMDGSLHDGPDQPGGELSILTKQAGAQLEIYVMKGDKVGVYDRVQLLENAQGQPASAFVKQITWGPKGRVVALVYHQKLEDLHGWEGDFLHTFKLRSYRLPFD